MNCQEIELKFGVIGVCTNLRKILQSIGKVENEHVDNLTNIYFDTNKRDFYEMQAGLRIRKANDYTEQTLKIRGSNIAGVHVRNEYNVRIDENAKKPDLSLFPLDAFPDGTDLAQLQKKLRKDCELDFTRHSYDFRFGEALFEVSYDRGGILYEGGKYPINELEVELKEASLSEEELLDAFLNLVKALDEKGIALTLEPFSKMHKDAVLLRNERNQIRLPDSGPHNVSEFLIGLIIMFEKMIGLLMVKQNPAVLGYISYTLKAINKALKELKRELKMAFPSEQIKPLLKEIKDLRAILMHMYKYMHALEGEFLNVAFAIDEHEIASTVEVLRAKIGKTKLYMLPLRIRVLLNKIAAAYEK